MPSLLVDVDGRPVAFRTPWDGSQDEMDFDRRNPAQAVAMLAQSDVAAAVESP
jgi:hypothetical protein